MKLIDFIIHIDHHLHQIIITYENWVYGILFLIIFIETGLVIMPFLPGDSLLFAAGTLCAISGTPELENKGLNVWILMLLLTLAAVLGDSVNYSIGKLFGTKVFGKLINPNHIKQTELFFEKHGGKAIIYARFAPFLRTFAPFVAGIGSMNYNRFLFYNFVGAFSWIFSITLLGYFFGNIPLVKNNFKIVIVLIISLSLIQPVLEVIRSKKAS
jgi:membrane-associated protein